MLKHRYTLLVLRFYSQLCNNTAFHATAQEIDLGCANNVSGNKKCIALLGFLAFTSRDLTRRFKGFSKTACFNRFKGNSLVHKVFAPLGTTYAALCFAIYQSQLVCNTWKKLLFPVPSYPNSHEYGWEYDTNNNFYETVRTDQLPAPKYILELCI